MKEILRNLGLAALVILFFILQTVFGEKLTLWGVKPEVLPFAAAAIGVLSGKTAGAWLGFLGGLLCDVISPWGLGPRAAVFFLAGAVAGELSRMTLRRGFLLAFLFGLAAAAVSQLADALTHAAVGYPYGDLLRGAAFGTLYSCILFPVAWLPVWGLAKLFPRPGESADAVPSVRIHELHGRRSRQGGGV